MVTERVPVNPFLSDGKSTHQTHRVKQSKAIDQLKGKQQTPEVAQRRVIREVHMPLKVCAILYTVLV